MTPRFEVGGPLVKDKLNFSQDLSYEFRRDPIHGLTWPFNETYVYAFDSFTNLQWILSPKHLINFNLNLFQSTQPLCEYRFAHPAVRFREFSPPRRVAWDFRMPTSSIPEWF